MKQEKSKNMPRQLLNSQEKPQPTQKSTYLSFKVKNRIEQKIKERASISFNKSTENRNSFQSMNDNSDRILIPSSKCNSQDHYFRQKTFIMA